MFWALLLCFCAFFSFLHLGSRDTPICYDWIQAELPESVTEVSLVSTHTTAPSLADMPLVSVSSVEVASSHTAGCCYPVLRISVPDTQQDEMSSLVTSFPAAVSEEAYVTVPFWELQEPASPRTAWLKALQASHSTSLQKVPETEPLHTSSSTHWLECSTWTFDSTTATNIKFKLALNSAQAAGSFLPLQGDGTSGPPCILTMIICVSQKSPDATSLQRAAPWPHSPPYMWCMGCALQYPTLGALEHPALMPSSAQLGCPLHSGDLALSLYLFQPVAANHFAGESSLSIC